MMAHLATWEVGALVLVGTAVVGAGTFLFILWLGSLCDPRNDR